MLLLALPSLLAVLHPVGLPHRLGASSKARVLTMCATDQADPSRWALFKDAEGVPQLRAASGEFLESMEKIRVERSPERPGLGIGLVEHGAADDGSAALVLVSEVAPGSNADVAASAPLMPGDALLYVGYPGAAAKGEATRVEGRSYDDTVEAIASLPDGPIELVIKRLTVRPKATVTLQFPEAEGRADESIVLYAGANLRRSILTRGITLNDPLARRFDAGVGTGDCGGEGCCCTCAVDVLSGIEALSSPKSQETQMLSRFPRWRLACRARIVDIEQDVDIKIKVQPRGFDGFYSDAECDIDGKPLKRESQK